MRSTWKFRRLPSAQGQLIGHLMPPAPVTSFAVPGNSLTGWTRAWTFLGIIILPKPAQVWKALGSTVSFTGGTPHGRACSTHQGRRAGVTTQHSGVSGHCHLPTSVCGVSEQISCLTRMVDLGRVKTRSVFLLLNVYYFHILPRSDNLCSGFKSLTKAHAFFKGGPLPST